MIEEFEGKEVKILYRDGDLTKTYYGKFVICEQFLEFTLRDGTKMLVNKSEILKVIEK